MPQSKFDAVLKAALSGDKDAVDKAIASAQFTLMELLSLPSQFQALPATTKSKLAGVFEYNPNILPPAAIPAVQSALKGIKPTTFTPPESSKATATKAVAALPVPPETIPPNKTAGFAPDPNGNIFQKYAYVVQEQAGIRKQPISPALANVLDKAAEAAGVEVRVFSGGQPEKGSGGARTGSTRHDNGMAADLVLYKDGQKLDFTKASDLPTVQAFIRAAVEAGATGIGAGVGYMGASGIHVGFGPNGVMGGPLVTWGPGEHTATTPAWLREALLGVTPGQVSDNAFAFSDVTPGSAQQAIADLVAGPQSKEKVQAIQKVLADSGFNPGKIDGIVGPRTMAAVQAFTASGGVSHRPPTGAQPGPDIETAAPGGGSGTTDADRMAASSWQRNWQDFDPYALSGRTPEQFAAEAKLPPGTNRTSDAERAFASSWLKNWSTYDPYALTGQTPQEYAAAARVAQTSTTDAERAFASSWRKNWANFDPYALSGQTPEEVAAAANGETPQAAGPSTMDGYVNASPRPSADPMRPSDNAPIASVEPAFRTAQPLIQKGGTIEKGTRGSQAREVQRFLNANGYTDKNGKPLKEDGIVGIRTRQAIKAYQQEKGLRVDGRVGIRTLSEMVQDTPDIVSYADPVPSPNLRPGEGGVPDFNVALAANSMLEPAVIASNAIPPTAISNADPSSYRAPMTAAAAAFGMALAGGVGVAAPLPSPGLAMAGLTMQQPSVMAYSGDNLDLHMDRIMNYPVTGDPIDPMRPSAAGDTLGLGGQDDSLDTIYGATRTFAALMREREGALRNSDASRNAGQSNASVAALFAPSFNADSASTAFGGSTFDGKPAEQNGSSFPDKPSQSFTGGDRPSTTTSTAGKPSTTTSTTGKPSSTGGGASKPSSSISGGIKSSTGFNTDAAGRVLGGI